MIDSKYSMISITSEETSKHPSLAKNIKTDEEGKKFAA